MALHVDRIEITPATPNRRTVELVFLHGLLGQGRNLKTFAKQVCELRQQNGLLMDLRGHGKSRLLLGGGRGGPTFSDNKEKKKTTFVDCVADIDYTLNQQAHEGGSTTNPPMMMMVVVGHSWGGRMAVQYAHHTLNTNDNGNGASMGIEHVWLLDVVPGQANESVESVVNIVHKLQQQEAGIESKKDLLRRLTEEEGLDMPTASWLASSYQGPGDFGFDLSVVQDILPEFATQDMEGMMVELLQAGINIDLVRGGRNKAWDIPTLNRLEKLQREFPGVFGLHVLPNAGHWVHVDDLKGLVSLLVAKPKN
jgi:pimeloyl-ACP methyl ester carboxylesterase